MINYGSAPTSDEIEIIVFGPGYGEAIAVHVGAGHWILIDSCIDPYTKFPASHTYLQRIGIQPNQVKTIVASHWHDDHIRGISDLAGYYPDAEFMISSALNNREAAAFLSAHNGIAAPGLSRGANELYKVMTQRDKIFHVMQRSSIMEVNANGKNVKVAALSPVPAAFSQSIAHFAQYLPRQTGGSPVNHAPELKPNLEAIAIHIDFDGDAALFGSDLEEHESFGWTALIIDQWCNSKPSSSAYKIAHHGSHSGEHQQIWTTLLTENPIVCMTPFSQGRVKLPTDHDKNRIRGKTPNAYISSGATKRPNMDSTDLKRLGDICNKLTRVNSGFGAIRLRKTKNNKFWTTELFGNACSL
jgi:hypothetical protein